MPEKAKFEETLDIEVYFLIRLTESSLSSNNRQRFTAKINAALRQSVSLKFFFLNTQTTH